MSLLLELCEPFFQFICRLNRSARKGADIDAGAVEADLKAILKEMEQTASSRPEVLSQFEKIRMPLIFFADYMIKESNLPFAYDWQELGKAEGEHAGDEKFFDLLEDTLAEDSELASERLLVFYQCLGLGFTGFYAGQPDYLRRTMKQISGRIRKHIDLSDASLVCPEAYENVDQSDLIEPPAKKMVGTGLVVFGLIIVLFVTFIVLFITSQAELGQALDQIIATQPTSGGDNS